VFFFTCNLPFLTRKKLEKEINESLPLTAFLCYLEIFTGARPQIAVKHLANSDSTKKELYKIDKLISNSVPFNLFKIFYSPPTKELAKFIDVLSRENIAELKEFCHDLLETQRNLTKKHYAKANVMALFFIAIAATVPALFSAVVLVGSILGFTFTPIQVILIFTILFPALDAAFLYCLDFAI